MIQTKMAEKEDWNILPSVVLLEIFKRLSSSDRINASSTCKHWRRTVFCSNFCPNLKLIYSENDDHLKRAQFLVQSFLTSSKSVAFIFSDHPNYLKQLSEAFDILSDNRLVQEIQILGQTLNLRRADELKSCVQNFYQCLDNIQNLKLLNIDCSWLIGGCCNELISALNKHSSTLIKLGLGHNNSNNNQLLYGSCGTYKIKPTINFSIFTNLTILKIHATWLDDDILYSISNNNTNLRRLVIELNVLPENRVQSDCWLHFHKKMPECELRVNLVRSSDVAALEFFRECMPVTHIKLIFCSSFDLMALYQFTEYRELKSIYCVLENSNAHWKIEDPFVLCSWKCPKLSEMVLMGWRIDVDNLIGIACLKQSKLKTLSVCNRDLVRYLRIDPGDNSKLMWRRLRNTEVNILKNKISGVIEQPWSPIYEPPFEQPVRKKLTDLQLNFLIACLSRDFSDELV